VNASVIGDVLRERQRQEDLHAPETCANPRMDGNVKLAVLTEEVGEVAKAWNDGDRPGHELRTELIHVAAVAIAWAESLA
jgi:hypothetical protein